jgi:hypothetical protein
MVTRGSLLNQLYVVAQDEPPEGHPPAEPTAGISLVADILRRDDTDRSATETEQTLWADHDALHRWAPIYDDLTERTNTPHHLAIVRAAAGPHIAQRLADDPALPDLTRHLCALAQAGYNPDHVLTAAAGHRELQTARDVAAVLAWRVHQLYAGAPLDPSVALSRAHAASFTARVAEPDGDLGKALRGVAEICDSRTHGLAEQAADLHPAWSTALGPVPDERNARQQWLAQARVIVTYRDRYQITNDDPIGPEPTHHDPARWAAWTRAQTILGVATLTGQIHAATDTELRTMIDAQRAADATAPTYVAGALRTAHITLVAAQQHDQELRLSLTAAEDTATRQSQRATSTTPRWWHVGPLRTRAAIRHNTTQATASDAQNVTDDLRTQLADAARQTTERHTNVTGLEAQHQVWTNWYQQALPTRYAGLAAAAETALRAQHAAETAHQLVNAVRDTAARVHAIDATRPQPHTNPVPEQLPAAAQASRDRVAALLDPTSEEPNRDPDTGPSIDL